MGEPDVSLERLSYLRRRRQTRIAVITCRVGLLLALFAAAARRLCYSR